MQYHRAGGDYMMRNPPLPLPLRIYDDPESFFLVALVTFFLNPLFGFIACCLSCTLDKRGSHPQHIKEM